MAIQTLFFIWFGIASAAALGTLAFVLIKRMEHETKLYLAARANGAAHYAAVAKSHR
jgi:hypothetical protein